MTSAVKLKGLGELRASVAACEKTAIGPCNSAEGGWAVFWKCTVSIFAPPDSKCGSISTSTFSGSASVVWNRGMLQRTRLNWYWRAPGRGEAEGLPWSS